MSTSECCNTKFVTDITNFTDSDVAKLNSNSLEKFAMQMDAAFVKCVETEPVLPMEITMILIFKYTHTYSYLKKNTKSESCRMFKTAKVFLCYSKQFYLYLLNDAINEMQTGMVSIQVV